MSESILRKDARFMDRRNWTMDELKELGPAIKTVASVCGIDSKQKWTALKTEIIVGNHPHLTEVEYKELQAIKNKEVKDKCNKARSSEDFKKVNDRKLGKDSYHFKYVSAKITEPKIYHQFKGWIEAKDKDWSHLTGQLRDHNEKKHNKLSSVQQDYFRILAKKLIANVDENIGADKFYDNHDGIWNVIYWVSFLVDLSAVVLSNKPDDCILPVEMPRKRGWIVDRRRVAKTFNSEFVRQCTSRLVLWLNTQLGQQILTVSHKCINPHCENPSHLVNESQEQNNSREKCVAHQTKGCLLSCKCFEYCVPNVNGEFVGCHMHGESCWTKALEVQKEQKEKHAETLNNLDLVIDEEKHRLAFTVPAFVDLKAITQKMFNNIIKLLPRVEVFDFKDEPAKEVKGSAPLFADSNLTSSQKRRLNVDSTEETPAKKSKLPFFSH